MSQNFFDALVWVWIALAIVVVPPQLAITAPYGRHRSAKWGPGIDNRLGWIIMEGASPVAFAWTLFANGGPTSAAVWLLAVLWIGHYFNRAVIYPLRTRTRGKFIPAAIVLAGVGFNGFNGWINAYVLTAPWTGYPESWFADPRFLIGLIVFAAGAAINVRSDNALIALRKRSAADYSVPQGGMFRFVSCPNHFGEIVEWTGFALMAWNLPALSFAIWTAANLGPRALSHHRWYRERFPGYPRERRALVPFVL